MEMMPFCLAMMSAIDSNVLPVAIPWLQTLGYKPLVTNPLVTGTIPWLQFRYNSLVTNSYKRIFDFDHEMITTDHSPT